MMNQLFQLLSSIASIVGIPLAIYLYLRSKDHKFEKIKADVIRSISYQIGDNRDLESFELNAIIKSKLRNAKFKDTDLKLEEVIEDLVAETTSSPLIESERKKKIVDNLKVIYLKGQINNAFRQAENDTIKKLLSEKDTEKKKVLERELLTEHQKMIQNIEFDLKKRHESIKELENRAKRVSVSNIYVKLLAIISFLVFAIAYIIDDVENFDFIRDFINSSSLSQDTVLLFTSIIASLIAAITSNLIKYLYEKSR